MINFGFPETTFDCFIKYFPRLFFNCSTAEFRFFTSEILCPLSRYQSSARASRSKLKIILGSFCYPGNLWKATRKSEFWFSAVDTAELKWTQLLLSSSETKKTMLLSTLGNRYKLNMYAQGCSVQGCLWWQNFENNSHDSASIWEWIHSLKLIKLTHIYWRG